MTTPVKALQEPCDGGSAASPSRRSRLVAALLIGLASALFTRMVFVVTSVPPDFEFWWRGTQLLLAGSNPYHAVPHAANWPLRDPLFYPMPALMLSVPLAPLPLPIAGAVFMGASGALLAWNITRDGLWRLLLFGSASYYMSLRYGQWSPLVSVVALVPAAGWLAAMKPNLGLALLCYRPSWRAIAGCGIIGLLSLLVLPTWLFDWHSNLDALVGHPPPILTPLGPLLLLALLRWRRPETRLLLAMACVPQLLFFADQLPLFLIPRTRNEAGVLSACSFVAFFAWLSKFITTEQYVAAATPYVMWSIYVPCLVMILRRPNTGSDTAPLAGARGAGLWQHRWQR
jgi:hypothetical protein